MRLPSGLRVYMRCIVALFVWGGEILSQSLVGLCLPVDRLETGRMGGKKKTFYL